MDVIIHAKLLLSLAMRERTGAAFVALQAKGVIDPDYCWPYLETTTMQTIIRRTNRPPPPPPSWA